MRWLLSPGGVSQLLTQVAAIKWTGKKISHAFVSSVCYYWDKAMEGALRETCDAFQLEFLGNIKPLDYSQAFTANQSFAFRFLHRVAPRSYHRAMLRRHGLKQTRDIQGLVVAIRPWVYDELFLHSVLQPVGLICVIDGVNPRLPKRALHGAAWKGLDAPFRDLPGEFSVFCPEYLKNDANQIGKAAIIADSVLASVFERYRSTPLAKEFADLLGMRTGSPTDIGLIFSQQLALCEYMPMREEIGYYLNAIKYLQDGGYRRIVFKPHPRDPSEKIDAIKQATAGMGNVEIIPKHLSPIPIEPFLGRLRRSRLIGLSTNSTVLLSFRALTGEPIVSFDSPHFTRDFCKIRDEFCMKHNIEKVVV